MLDRFFPNLRVLERVRSSDFGIGLDGFAAYLERRGHTFEVTQEYLRASAHFARWVQDVGLEMATVAEDTVGRFLDAHRVGCRCPVQSGKTFSHLGPAAGHLLRFLRERGLIAPRPEPSPTPSEGVLGAFDAYLRRICGMTARTCSDYRKQVRQFLTAMYPDGAIDLGRLTPNDLRSYVADRSARVKHETAKKTATTLRRFLRCLQLQGLCDARLLEAIPTIPGWKLARLPKPLTEDELGRLLGSFGGRSGMARRDHAMALCLVRLGMRAGEVAELCLEDFDWRAGTVRIAAGKRRRPHVLPLPVDVGRAIVAYLRKGRPPTSSRRLFVKHFPPVGEPIRSNVVANAVRRAQVRAGLKGRARGTHVLRQTAASRLLNAGASLKEIADLLGHRHIDTTAIYTKVDLRKLTEVALAWPEAES
jgi:site-specific recombinase XerD